MLPIHTIIINLIKKMNDAWINSLKWMDVQMNGQMAIINVHEQLTTCQQGKFGRGGPTYINT